MVIIYTNAEVNLRSFFSDRIGSRSGTKCDRAKFDVLEKSHKMRCATQVGLAPQYATEIYLIRAHFGLDGLVKAGLGRAPHPVYGRIKVYSSVDVDL